ncbi:uncharacterized protein TM35_000471620 [Trypanosoma theileri]|uniref:Mucin TcMUCII n=1 Tax=Trypanosoma theileri TaxID=67003 RepID=A0A1X0NHY6_9TRYP|nr:uncharacterized protein TM35_000471620 [Trypanosoma theileri]ORC84267.1 hypothetical protein TM35_000471620 [Trypanosoma theileri]
MMMMMRRVMCVLAVVLCCPCGYTMTAAASTAGQLKAVMALDGIPGGDGAFEEYDPDIFRNTHRGGSGSSSESRSLPATGIHPSNSQEQDIHSRPGVSEQRDERQEVPVPAPLPGPLEAPVKGPAQPPSEGPHVDQNVVKHGEKQPQITSSPVQEDGTQHVSAAVSSSVISAPQAERSTSTNGGGDSAEEHTETQQSNPPKEGNPGSSNNTGDNIVPGDNNTPQQSSPAPVNATATPDSQETNTTTPPISDNTTTEAPTTTTSPVPVPNAEISNTITSTPKNKANADSSISSVWMHTAAPLLIVALLFSFTVY